MSWICVPSYPWTVIETDLALHIRDSRIESRMEENNSTDCAFGAIMIPRPCIKVMPELELLVIVVHHVSE